MNDSYGEYLMEPSYKSSNKLLNVRYFKKHFVITDQLDAI